MSRQCPSCKMESADDAAWCDFCKEPFRKAAPKPETKTTERLPPPAGKLSEDELLKRLPSEFIQGDDGMRIPKLPPWFKWLAWAFLGSWLVSGMILFGVLMGRKKLSEAQQPQPLPAKAQGATTYDSGPIVVPDSKP